MLKLFFEYAKNQSQNKTLHKNIMKQYNQINKIQTPVIENDELDDKDNLSYGDHQSFIITSQKLTKKEVNFIITEADFKFSKSNDFQKTGV